MVAGPHYAARPLHRALFGSDYRDLWTAPVRVPLLDMETFAGGLRTVRSGGGEQTRALRLEGADGRAYNFRSVDKDAARGLPSWLRRSPLDRVMQDQTSALHPAAAGIAASLTEAVDVLHPDPRLVVLPDDPRLSVFREEFAGMLGWIELHADEDEEVPERGFAGSPRVVGTQRLLEHFEDDPGLNRPDAHAYLRLRLVDILIADWDRHPGQTRWARADRDGLHVWRPVPEDRDYAFVSYDGLLTPLVRWLIAPRARPYRPRYRGELFHLVRSGLELDRVILADLTAAEWQAVAVDVRKRLTDDAIDAALRTMPDEWHRVGAPPLRAILRARRDALLPQAAAFRDLVMWNPADHPPPPVRSPR